MLNHFFPSARRAFTVWSGLWITLLLAACEAEPAKASGQPSREEAESIHVLLVGDSTVTEKAGWGKAFAKRLIRGVRVTNKATGGASSRSFLDTGSWTAALAERPTHVLIQFGHNDMPGKGPLLETDAATTFPRNLARFVDESRAAGARPILITSIPRRLFEGPKLRGELAPYAAATRRVAAEKNVPLADLYARGVETLEQLGPAASESFGPWLPKGGRDFTHLARAGAEFTADQLVAELRRVAPELARFFRPENE